MIDCLLIGFNDPNFEGYVDMVKSMGTNSGAYRDLRLAFVEYNNKPYRSMDLLNLFHFEKEPENHKVFHNADFLWPVITYLGSYLHQRGFSFDYVNLFQLEKEKLIEKLTKNIIRTVAITTTLYVSVHPILEIISFIRKYNSSVKIIVGGPYIYNQTKDTDKVTIERLFKYIDADFYVISSEGEFALAHILMALKSGSSFDGVNNIAYRNGNTFVITSSGVESNSLEENMVNYSLFPKEEFGQFVTLRTAKSCPFACAFCGFPQRAGKYTYMDLRCVEQELNAIRDIDGVTTLTFIDDTFNVPKGRFKEILRMMIRNKYGFKWNSYFRSDHADEEAIELMGQAGCEGVFLGVESGSDQLLQRMNKTARRRHYAKAIPLLKAAGISTHANLIIGFPGETYETVQETMDFIETAQPDFFRAQQWYCDPTTPIWQQREHYGIKGSAFNWTHNTMDANTAADLVDKVFLSIENSHWLPQYGFEQWSIFYLQRQGMTMEQIKAFVKSFNDMIKERLLHPEKKTIDPNLLDRLKATSRFRDCAPAEQEIVKLFSTPSSVATELFWLKEFQGSSTTSSLETVLEPSGCIESTLVATTCMVQGTILEQLRRHYSADRAGVMLAAYSLLLSRLNGLQEVSLLSASSPDDSELVLVPLRLYPRWALPFRQFVQQVQHQLLQTAPHQPYAFQTLSNLQLMKAHGCSSPILDVGYLTGQGVPQTLFSAHPLQGQHLKLLLQVTGDAQKQMSLQLISPQGCLKPRMLEQLTTYLHTILEAVTTHPELTLQEILLVREDESVTFPPPEDSSEVFNFQ
ncbi:MAG TPA: PhpK family radical SAM P-methyltransferase [Ktedonobacteraceae bacterium]|nr:PhpK family radical SAM P-methyltransferase [Ktedonobacteraceae bacterium]